MLLDWEIHLERIFALNVLEPNSTLNRFSPWTFLKRIKSMVEHFWILKNVLNLKQTWMVSLHERFSPWKFMKKNKKSMVEHFLYWKQLFWTLHIYEWFPSMNDFRLEHLIGTWTESHLERISALNIYGKEHVSWLKISECWKNVLNLKHLWIVLHHERIFCLENL
jgi:hypothetical protein